MNTNSSHSRGPRLLLGVTGGVAAFKAVLLLRALQEEGVEVRVAMTDSATKFVGEATFQALTGQPVYRDIWDLDRSEGGELHVDLSAWADAIVVYPATLDFLVRASSGRANDLLALSVSCFDGPVLLCPAMHHRMAAQAAYEDALRRLRESGVSVLPPVSGRLASGEIGEGRLPEPADALLAIKDLLRPPDLVGRTVLVTAGPTREHLDPVRFLSNPSTGKMGYAVARAAARRGARVLVVSGPTALSPPAGVECCAVTTAAEMHTEVEARFDQADVVVMAAAVADFRPVATADHKLKKGSGNELSSVRMEPTTDILASLGQRKGHRVLVGFAMETEKLLDGAQSKLERKNLDLIVANNLTTEGAGFGVNTNVVTLLARHGEPVELPRLSKDRVAHEIIDRIVPLLAERD
ncbi:MAG TPA: bifunctional phosphopantothenoylcysteine decarboxylase/phosphopantothenate--cysteine ligase CoaBC [Deltaproteobacteria bacterium]|nr:bifunctional phosphopantothenoylcysteine decarboxylase/phosphopantothenate--cysteine ligase CoaBC [Deltaproteobacteria bacterium]HCP44996.1 bifunctional phosphopantothenoylcysteine decarboxylase/phosphopantothenate--cysteine ligase CoaBC [Deltaproteobacteria bacterium]